MTLTTLITAALANLVTLDEQRTALAAILALVPNVTTAFARRPRSLTQSELPAVILYPTGQARYEQRYAGHLKMIRAWVAAVYAAPVTAGLEFEAEAAAEPYMDSIALALTLCPEVQVADGRVFWVQPLGSGAIRQLPYNSVFYAVLEQQFQTDVETLLPVQPAYSIP